MNKYTLRFNSEVKEARYIAAIEANRETQMRLALLLVGILYIVVSVLDHFFMPEKVRDLAFWLHLSEGILFSGVATFLFISRSLKAHTLLIVCAVSLAWAIHLILISLGGASMLFGEAYLMIIWIWLISGLSLKQAAVLNGIFIFVFEFMLFSGSPLPTAEMVGHHFFIYVSVLLGALGAFLTEFYKRQNFDSLETLKNQAKALEEANEKLDQDKLTMTKLSKAVEQSGEAILMTDALGASEYVNPSFTKMTGYAAEEILGAIPTFLIQHDQNDPAYKMLLAAMKAGIVWQGRLMAKKKNGETYPAFVSITPIHNEVGVVTHYVASQNDMTEYQQLESHLQQAQKMDSIGTLVGGIAHDFNNTLAGIAGNIYLAKQELKDQPQTKAKLERIEGLAFRSANTVRQLLAFSRKDVVSKQSIDICELVSTVANLQKVTLPEDIAFIERGCDGLTAMVWADESQLEQVVMNFLINARDAVVSMKAPEIILAVNKVKVEAQFLETHSELKDGEYVRISVIDNGSGIREENLQKIFEPFFTTKDVDKGTGLGLSMAYGVVQSHGGVIEVESDWGKGTQFHMYLPVLKHPETSKKEQDNQPMLLGLGQTILIADDEISVSTTIAEVLKAWGYKVLTAKNGEEAVALYAKHAQDIQLVILDVVMPKLGGVEASERMRQINPNLQVLFLTGYDASQQLNMDKHSIEKVLVKPFAMHDFNQLVQSMLLNKG